jgi:AAA15 family ATPase/GTPase
VFICDELDGNLHPLIVQALLEEFLASSGSDNRAQLIFASHDVTLLDQYLLRRDEIWFVSKRGSGSTRLESLGDYKDVRVDTDILKGYIMGRYSGVPNVGELLEIA